MIALGLLGVLAATLPAVAVDIEAGRTKAKPCDACHGEDGIGTMPVFPNLAGQKALYLEKQLLAFRDGSRRSEVMGIVVKTLSDVDIRNLAAYYAHLAPDCRSQ